MAGIQTKPTKYSVSQFVKNIEDEQKREDSKTLVKLMQDITGKKAVMWGNSMIGFGKYAYTYASGHGGEWFLVGFAPRKVNLTVYIMPGFEDMNDLLKDLGKCKTAKSCLYIKKLEDIDVKILKKMIKRSLKIMEQRYGK